MLLARAAGVDCSVAQTLTDDQSRESARRHVELWRTACLVPGEEWHAARATCSTLQIGSTPKVARCSSTSPLRLDPVVELRRGREAASSGDLPTL